MAASPIASTSAVPMHVSTPARANRAPKPRATSPPTPDLEQDSDRFYGQKDMALLCEHVISALFDISSTFPGMPPTPPLSPSGKEPPHLVEFIAYALYRTRLPDAVVHHALFLLSRLKARYPSARGTASSPHRLFLSSLMLSSKINMDDTYSNRSWTIVGGNFFALKEVNQMERELFAFLGWNVVVRSDDLAMFVKRIELDHAAHKLAGGSRKRTTLVSQLLPSLGPTATPPLSPPPERERSKRRRESSCSRSAQAEAAAIALLRPGQSSSGPFAARRTAVLSSNESSAESSAASSVLSSPHIISPITPHSPASPEHHKAWSKGEYSGPRLYRAASGVF